MFCAFAPPRSARGLARLITASFAAPHMSGRKNRAKLLSGRWLTKTPAMG